VLALGDWALVVFLAGTFMLATAATVNAFPTTAFFPGTIKALRRGLAGTRVCSLMEDRAVGDVDFVTRPAVAWDVMTEVVESLRFGAEEAVDVAVATERLRLEDRIAEADTEDVEAEEPRRVRRVGAMMIDRPSRCFPSSSSARRHMATFTTLPESKRSVDVVVVGGGLIGLSVAHHLVRNATKPIKVLILEKESEIMSVTSSKSTGGFRNFYPQFGSMTALSNRSIDLLRTLSAESGDSFGFTRAGYIFLSTGKRNVKLHDYIDMAMSASENGSGAVRTYGMGASGRDGWRERYEKWKDGIDVVDDVDMIRRLVPGVAEDARVMMHVRKAGFLDVAALGKYLLHASERKGVQLLHGTLSAISTSDSSVRCITITPPSPGPCIEIHTNALVLASGPYLPNTLSLLPPHLDPKFPLVNELHARVFIPDPDGLLPPSSAFTIWSDDIDCTFSDAERDVITRSAASLPADRARKIRDVLSAINVPGIAGCHARPLTPSERQRQGRDGFYGIWTYDND
ncbi:hypothetical protein HK101_003663, partial [Irineochytrium annulatum]